MKHFYTERDSVIEKSFYSCRVNDHSYEFSCFYDDLHNPVIIKEIINAGKYATTWYSDDNVTYMFLLSSMGSAGVTKIPGLIQYSPYRDQHIENLLMLK